MTAPASSPPRPALAAWARGLLARFDAAVMRVGPPRTIAGAAAPASVRMRLDAWCFAGIGDGHDPVWRPFTVATLLGGGEAERASLVEAVSRHLDGSDQLAAGGAFAGLLLRLRVKCHDAMWWRARQAADSWDCGHLLGESAALQRFEPRRATLLVADGVADAALREAVHILRARSAAFHHPVRLLVLDRSSEALAWSSTLSNSEAITEIVWPSDATPSSAAIASIASASR